MAILKYKDEDGFWQELPVGTNIAANPPLAGTEANLTGLQVDDTTYKVPVAGEKVSITAPQGATNGTITGEQLAKLQENEANYIEMVNDKELYYLNDNGHVDGYLTYSHVGIENSKATIKTLTITVSAKSFVIVTTVVPTDAGGGKLYRHVVNAEFTETTDSKSMNATIVYYRSDTKSFETAFNNQDYSVIKDLGYASIIVNFFGPTENYTPCRGFGMFRDMSSSSGLSPIISDSDVFGVLYVSSGAFYHSLSYEFQITQVNMESITEV